MKIYEAPSKTIIVDSDGDINKIVGIMEKSKIFEGVLIKGTLSLFKIAFEAELQRLLKGV